MTKLLNLKENDIPILPRHAKLRYDEARKKISQWIGNGSLKLPEFVCDGDIEEFPNAFKKLFEGKNFGKMLLKLPAAK